MLCTVIMKNETIIKRVFKDFGEDFNDLTGSQLLAIEECMLLARQDKKMYSEEDLREAFTQGMENMDYCEMYGWSSKLTEQQWFEQFKNK